jgi:hypothetical protein
MSVRTTTEERLEYLRWMRDGLLAYKAEEKDLDDAIKELNLAIRRREKELYK